MLRIPKYAMAPGIPAFANRAATWKASWSAPSSASSIATASLCCSFGQREKGLDSLRLRSRHFATPPPDTPSTALCAALRIDQFGVDQALRRPRSRSPSSIASFVRKAGVWGKFDGGIEIGLRLVGLSCGDKRVRPSVKRRVYVEGEHVVGLAQLIDRFGNSTNVHQHPAVLMMLAPAIEPPGRDGALQQAFPADPIVPIEQQWT